MIPFNRLMDGRDHQVRLNKYDRNSLVSDTVFDFLVVLFDVPAYIWYWWLEVLVQTGYCGGDSGTTYGIYKQLVLGMLFYMSLRILKIIWHTYGNSKILRYLQEKGFWRPGWVPIIMQRILSCMSLTF